MPRAGRTFWMLLGVFAVLFSPGVYGQEEAGMQGALPKVGPPQVLEIPALIPPTPSPLPEGVTRVTKLPPSQPSLPSQPLGRRRGYLGVLYGTAEEGPPGVQVLGVIEGSPAQRAGFEGPLRSPTWKDQAIKLAIPLLVLSPAAPLAIPLAIAHDVYHSRQDLGDLIVQVNGQPVRSAQEFTEIMRRFGPGDTVSFKVLRGKKLVQLTARLEEEPS